MSMCLPLATSTLRLSRECIQEETERSTLHVPDENEKVSSFKNDMVNQVEIE